MPVLTDVERRDLAARVRTRWRRWSAHLYLETVTPLPHTYSEEHADQELLFVALTSLGFDLLDEMSTSREALREGLDGLLLRCAHAFSVALEDPRTRHEVDAIAREMRRVLDPSHPERN